MNRARAAFSFCIAAENGAEIKVGPGKNDLPLVHCTRYRRVMDVRLRQAAPGDAEALAVVGAATFLESYAGVVDGGAIVRHCLEKHAPSVYAEALSDPAQRLWLAEMAPGGAPVGYLHLTPPDLPIPTAPVDLEIKRIYVLSRLQRTGLGRRLLETAQTYARSAGAERLLLGVYEHNARALSFYRKTGFEIVGARRFDVGGRVYDDHVLAKAL